MNNKEISIERANRLLKNSRNVFTELFKHGTLVVEFYKPEKVDNQKPHNRDEIYVVATGTGVFNNGGKKWNFKPGDFLFVPAGIEHRFEDFTEISRRGFSFMGLWEGRSLKHFTRLSSK